MKNEQFKEVYQYTLGALTVLAFFAAVYISFTIDMPTPNKEIIYILIGSLVTKYGDVINYFYGSSKGSSDKTKMLNNNKTE